MTIEVHVRLFARLRELCGRDELSLELPAGADVSDCFERLAERHPRLAAQRERLGVAVNLDYVTWDHPLEDGDGVTFIPPVSGGRRDGSATTARSDLARPPGSPFPWPRN